MDAIRIADDKHVVLKRIDRSPVTEEYDILRFLSEGSLQSDPHNLCVPVLEFLDPPDDEPHMLVVFPVLRSFDDPEFDTIGEGLDFIRQMLQVRQYNLQ